MLHNYPWNPDEQLTSIEKNNLEQIISQWTRIGLPIDFVVSHTFPYKLQKYYEDLFLDGLNQDEVDNSMEKWLDHISEYYENLSKFKCYFGGHFHDDRILTDKYIMLYQDVENLADYEKE